MRNCTNPRGTPGCHEKRAGGLARFHKRRIDIADRTRAPATSENCVPAHNSAAMPHYRLYPLDERGHVCDPPQIIEAKTDADAIAQAMQLVNGHDLEVWDMARRVGLIERQSD